MKLISVSLSVPSCTRLVGLFAMSAAVVALSGCGDDVGINGPSVVDEDTTGGGQDGTLSGDGAVLDQDGVIVVDVIPGADGTVSPDDATVGADTIVNPNKSCNGKCGVYDPKAACQCDDQCTGKGDCCGDYTAQCGAVAKTCGDGKCTPPEDAKSCPGDCGTVTTPFTCKGNCGVYDQKNSCQCDDQCTGKGDCCGDYTAECGAVAKTCGDGKCTPPEDATSCPGDCGSVTPPGTCNGKCGAAYDKNATCQCDTQCTGKGDCCGDYAALCGGTTSPVVSCIETNCAAEVATCNTDAACAKVVACAKNCTTQNCLFGCVQQGGGGGFNLPNGLQEVYTCGNNAKCFQQGGGGGPNTPVCGNGQCETGETAQSCAQDCGGATPACGNGKCDNGETTQNCAQDCPAQSANSCAGKCGQLNTSGGFGACQCQNWCVQAGNCCSDYQSLCGTTSTPVCGNGQCETGETAQNCAQDCGGGGTQTPDQCVQAKCATQYAACAKDPNCIAALPCVESGKQIWNCNVANWQAGMTLGQVQQCAAQNKCF